MGWLVGEGSMVAVALDTVSHECGGQCMCSAADLGLQEDSLTTASERESTTIPSDEASATTSQPSTGDGDLKDAPTPSGALEALKAAPGSPVASVCDSPCFFDGETHSCRERVQWLVTEGESTVVAALDLVSHECDGQCTCLPSELPEFQCESPCTFDGETYSCKGRVQWLVGENGSMVVAALDTVREECSGQCLCSVADFAGQVELLTSLSSVTTTQRSVSNTSGGTLTPSAGANSSEAAQDGGDRVQTNAGR